MARKSIKGYAEKNYYDNTRFGGGIVATNDPLNEGYFKSLVNFDISDTGYSLQPRKGFFTTTFKIKDITYTLSDKTIYFYDANIGKYIFIDFTNTDMDKELPLIILADFDINNMYLTNASICSKFDWTTVKEYFDDNGGASLINLNFATNKAELAMNEYNINTYIIKCEDIWVSFVYRDKETEYEGTVNEEKTLVMDYIDFTDTVSINMSDRNIASNSSIIPIPIQRVIPESDTETIQQFPLIYIKEKDVTDADGNIITGKYLLNTYKKEDFDVIPNFYINTPKPHYNLAYTYNIVSTSEITDITTTSIYKSPIYYLNTHEPVIDSCSNRSIWYNNWTTFNASRLETNLNGFLGNEESIEKDYLAYLDTVNIFKQSSDNSYTLNSTETKSTLIIYIAPAFDEYKPKSTNKMVQQIITSNDDFNHLFDNTEDNRSIYNRDGRTRISHNSLNYNYIPYVPEFSNKFNSEFTNNNLKSIEDILNFLKNTLYMKTNIIYDIDNFMFYTIPLSELTSGYKDANRGVMYGQETCLLNRVCASSVRGMTFQQLYSTLRDSKYSTFIFKMYTNTFMVKISTGLDYSLNGIGSFLPQIGEKIEEEKSKDTPGYIPYYIFTDVYADETYNKSYYDILGNVDLNMSTTNGVFELFKRLFKVYNNGYNDEYTSVISYTPLLEYESQGHYSSSNLPILSRPYNKLISSYMFNEYKPSVFKSRGLTMSASYSDIKNQLPVYFFEKGLIINMYLLQVPEHADDVTELYHYNREYLIASTSLKQSKQIIYSPIEPTTIIETLKDEPEDISSAKNSLIFRTAQGDHLVLYINNKLYISEANQQYYFKYTKTFSYPEQIVKVIQYKDTLLVFTTQNLYSVYPIEVTENVESGVDAEGNKQYTQVTTIEYGNLPVLYNLLVNEKYKDAIQVYNQMVLFYSADGQMFMIKPTATIDSNTRFSIQYFNKNANDILLNYTDYIRDRLRYYGYEIDDSIEQALNSITIKVSVSLNNIKIFYCVPGVMTYILVYDIINNRYYVYDTLSFTNVKHLEFIPEGELYIVEHNNQLYFTQPYVLPLQKNNNVDLSYFHSFTPEPIVTELDTGIENLNNHLKKRFRDLHIIYKNISAETLEFSLDVFVDNIPIITYINPEIQVQDSMYTVNDIYKTSTLVDLNRQVLDNNNALFDFSQFNSSKILTHKTNIISRGKTIRTKLCFKSDGVYKIQGYGLIYKEHTV